MLAAHALSGANSLAQEKHFHSNACVCVCLSTKGLARGEGEVNGSCLNLSILFCHIVFLCHVCRRLRLHCSLALCSDLKVPLSLANLLYLRWHSLTFCVSPRTSFPLLPFCNVVVAVVAFSNASSLCFTLSLCFFLLSPAVRVYYWYLLNEWIVRAPRHSHIFAHALHEAAAASNAASTAAFAAPVTTPPFPCSMRDCLGCLDLTQPRSLSPSPCLSGSLRLRLHSAVEI